MEKKPSISLKIKITPNTLGCYGLTQQPNEALPDLSTLTYLNVT